MELLYLASRRHNPAKQFIIDTFMHAMVFVTKSVPSKWYTRTHICIWGLLKSKCLNTAITTAKNKTYLSGAGVTNAKKLLPKSF